jgi:hypothetical protein
MPVPWLRILDAVIGVTDLMRSRRIRQLNPTGPPGAGAAMTDVQQVKQVQHAQQIDGGGPALGGLEARLAGVVVAALKEAFDRDTRRLELERQQLEAERARADRALRLELARQAGDREIGRLRLIALVGAGSWLATLLAAARVLAGGPAGRAVLGGGLVLLLAGSAASFAGQSRVSRALELMGDELGSADSTVSSGAAGALALWLVFAGLVLVGLATIVR